MPAETQPGGARVVNPMNAQDGEGEAEGEGEVPLQRSTSLQQLAFGIQTGHNYRGRRQQRCAQRPVERGATTARKDVTDDHGGVDDKRDGASWLDAQHEGGIYSEKRVIPSPPTRLAKLKYYWDGLVANEKNKWMYLEFRGELSFVQEKLSAIHTSFFEMDERRELHDEFMLDKEGQELDDAVEKISEGFVQRMVEEVALMYRDIDSIIREKGSDVNDIFFFARAPVGAFTDRYVKHRRNFVQHVEAFEIDRSASARDLASLTSEHNHELKLVHTRSTATEKAVPWDSDGDDGAMFDFLQEKLNELSATMTELDTMGQFVKLSVDNLDQLQFKAMLFMLNVTTFLARWLHNWIFPTEIGVDEQGQFASCSDGTEFHCAPCPEPVDVQALARALNGTVAAGGEG